MTRPVAAVTGGTGFLGRHAVAALAASGWDVRLLAQGGRAHPLLRGRDPARLPQVVAGGLGDAAALSRLVDGAAAVVHLAGLVKAVGPAAFEAVNRDGTAALAKAVARGAPGARFVHVSSQAAREPGLSSYAASKRAGEAAVQAILPPGGWIILRPCVVYGPGDVEGRALLRLARLPVVPVPSPPEPVIAMVHVRDVAAAIVAASRPGPAGLVWELCDDRAGGHPWREIIGALARTQGRAPRFLTVPDGVVRSVGALAEGWAALSGRPSLLGRGKAAEILHRDWSCDRRMVPPATLWQPGIRLQDGLDETVAWWRASGRRSATAGRGPALDPFGTEP